MKIAVFELPNSDEIFAFPAENIIEFMRTQDIKITKTGELNSPSYGFGIIRNTIFPVFNLNKLIGLTSKNIEIEHAKILMLIKTKKYGKILIPIHKIYRVFEISDNKIKIPKPKNKFFKNLIKISEIENKLVILLDI